MTRPRQIPARLNVTADTIEHVFDARQPPLAAALDGRFEVVQRPRDPNLDAASASGAESVVELLSMTPDNELLHVRPDDATASGWSETRVALPAWRADRTTLKGEVVRIDAFYQSRGIYALLHYRADNGSDTILPMYFTAADGWRELVVEGNVANALYQTRQTAVYRTPEGRHFFYGVSSAYSHPQFVVVFETAPGKLDSVYDRVPVEGSTYRLLPGDPGGDASLNACLRIDAAGVHLQPFTFEYDDEEDEYYFEWGAEQARVDLGFGAMTAANVFPFPSRVATQSLLLLGEDQQLHYLGGYVQGVLRARALTGGDGQPQGIAQVTLGRDENDRAIVFALSALDSRLWVLRQTGVDGNGDLEFADWVCLGNRANVIGAPRAMLDGAELFLINAADRGLEHMRQDRDTTFWMNSGVLAAGATPANAAPVSAHAVTVEVLDAGGGCVADAALEIRTSYATAINVNGFGLHVNAARWLPVSADDAGRLSLYIPAENLEPPIVEVRIKATGHVQRIDPGSRIADRLRGKDPRFEIDTKQLRAARLIPDAMPGNQANAVADMVRQMGRNMDGEGGDTRRLHVTGDVAEIKAVDVPVADAADVAKSLNVDAGGRSILGDLFNFIKHAWESVRDFVITVGKGVAELVLKVGERVVKLVVDTAKGIARAAEALFETLANLFRQAGEVIADVGRRLAKFVTALFGWDDILVTNEVVKFAANQTLESLRRTLDEDVVNWTQDKIEALRGGLDGLLDQAEQLIGPLDPTDRQGLAAGDTSGQSVRLLNTLSDNKVATQMVGDQMTRHARSVAGAMSYTPSPADEPLTAFIRGVEGAYKQRIETEAVAVFKDFRPQSPEELFAGGLVRTLRSLRPMLLFALEVGGELVKLAIRGLAHFFKLIHDLLNTELHLPVVSGFWQAAAGKPLTVLDLMSLLVAVPMTIVHKLLNKMQAPFTRASLSSLQGQADTWYEMIRYMAGMTQFDNGHRSVGSMATGESIPEKVKAGAQKLIDVLKGPAILCSLFSSATDFLYGFIMGGKHAADSKDLSGQGGGALKIVAYLAKFIRFIAGIPSKLVTLAGLVITAADKLIGENSGPFKLPYLLAIFSGIITVIGFGLTILGWISKVGALIANVVVDVVASVALQLLGLYTFVAIIQGGIVDPDGWRIAADTLEQIGTAVSLLPDMLSFIPPAVPILDSAYGAGEVLLVMLIVTDIATGFGAGFAGCAASTIRWIGHSNG